MTAFVQFVILGLGAGAVYAMLAQGLVVIYGGSGVVNFAQGAMAMIAAFLYWDLYDNRHWNSFAAVGAAIATATLGGGLIYVLIMKPLRRATSLARVVATLGLLIVLEATALLLWGDVPRLATPQLGIDIWRIRGVVIPVNRVYIFMIALALTATLWAYYRFAIRGLALRAASENRRAASALGWSPDALGTLSWALGGGLAGVAGVLITNITAISATDLPLTILAVLAAAVAGGFTSFWLTFLGGLAIGIIESLATLYVGFHGLPQALPFLVIVLLLVIRGKALPVRGYVGERFPDVGSGKIKWRVAIPLVFVTAVLVWRVFPISLVDGLMVSFAWATIMLSVVVLLGFTGQLSFEQMAMAGLAALVAGRLVAAGWPFEVACVVAVLAAVPVGLAFAGPALRTRGVNLAIVTLGLGISVYAVILTSVTFTGGFDGTTVGEQSFFGINISVVTRPRSYCLFVFSAFLLCAFVVSTIRRGVAGRRLLAVRTNERAAAALGISVLKAKVFAFIVGSTVAAIGGITLAFQSTVINYSEFNPLQSVLAVAYATVGGVGFILGAVMGSIATPGGVGAWIQENLFSADARWLMIIGGTFTIVVLVVEPNGLWTLKSRMTLAQVRALRWLNRRLPRGQSRLEAVPPLGEATLASESHAAQVQSDRTVNHPRVTQIGSARGALALPNSSLDISNLTVRYGGVCAVDQLSLNVGGGEIVGLIGPNGAGKTSAIDAITGFVNCDGEVRLDDQPIGEWPAYKRARAGVSRSFQSLELFEDTSLFENLLVAYDSGDDRTWASGLFRAKLPSAPPIAVDALERLGLASHLETRVSDLSYANRRLLATARAIAVAPRILLLDEPAAGLSDEEAAALADALRGLVRDWGFGVLVVEHNMGFVMSLCDRVLVLDFGHTIAVGGPAEITKDSRVREAYLGVDDGEPDEQFAPIVGGEAKIN